MALSHEWPRRLDSGERETTEPPPWSVLWHTVASLAHGDSASPTASTPNSARVTLASLSLPDAAWRRLRAAAIYPEDPLCTLESVTIAYWLSTGIDDDALDRLLQTAGKHEGAGACADSLDVSEQPIIHPEAVRDISGLHLETVAGPRSAVTVAYSAGLNTWHDCALMSEAQAVSRLGLTAASLRLILALWELRHAAERFLARLPNRLPADVYGSLDRLIDSFVALAARNEREAIVIKGRLGLLEGRKWKLRELASRLGITRARVSQIAQRGVRVLQQASSLGELWRLRLTVLDALSHVGGVCSVPELARKVGEHFGWGQPTDTHTFAGLVSLHEGVSVDPRSQEVAAAGHPCPICRAAQSVLKAAVVGHDGVLTTTDALARLGRYCQQSCSAEPKPSSQPAAALVHHVADTTPGFRRDGDLLYTDGQWAVRFGRLNEAIDAILRLTPGPMHYREVRAALSQYRAKRKLPSMRNVHARLSGGGYLLWDRGTFIHRAHVALPRGLLREVARWLGSRLQVEVPFYSITGAFARFKDECQAAGIPTEYALYSCLREAPSPRLSYPRFPYVLRATEDERIPVRLAFEEYALDAGEPVSTAEMREYALGKLGVSEQIFNLHLANVPNLIRVGRGRYLHSDLLAIPPAKLGPLIEALEQLLEVASHVSVAKLFEIREITCRTLGIATPVMLYGVLKHLEPEDLEFPGYPQIRRRLPGQARKAQTVTSRVVSYIAKKGGPCSIEGLEDRFVESLGYGAGTLESATRSRDVVRYSRGSCVHLSVLEWGPSKDKALCDRAKDRYARRAAAGHVYARLSELLEDIDLPVLASEVPWTRTLLAELLPREGHFVVLGNGRNAYVPIPNPHNIATFADLVARLLERNHEGACELADFEQELRQDGVIVRRLTSAMLGEGSPARIQNSVVLLAELATGA